MTPSKPPRLACCQLLTGSHGPPCGQSALRVLGARIKPHHAGGIGPAVGLTLGARALGQGRTLGRHAARAGAALLLAGVAGGTLAAAIPGTALAAQLGPDCPAAISGTTATVTCTYSGGSQYWTVPAGGDLGNGHAVRRRGRSRVRNHGGLGAEVAGTLNISPGTVLQVNAARPAAPAVPSSAVPGASFGGPAGRGLCLGVQSLAAGPAVTDSPCDGSSTQEWAQAGHGNGSYRLIAGGPTNLVLTGQEGNTDLTVGPPRSGVLQDWLEVASLTPHPVPAVPVTG